MYGLIGEKLSHSFSVQIHNLLADYEYKLFPMTPDEVGAFLAKRDFKGLNVTIPYKKTVIPYCDKLSSAAKRIGAVNTITVMQDGSLFGDNTDYFGFMYLLKKSRVNPTGKKAIVLGSGGASRTAASVLSDMGASDAVVISRNGKDNYENLSRHYDADIIVNATPVGMYPDCGKSPISLKEFKSCILVVDMIYNPSKTALLLDAEKLKIPFINGLTMLVAQAKKSAQYFIGDVIDDRQIEKITAKLAFEMQNIVLIGMPGSGKTTVGTALAQRLEREFIDTDEIIIKKTGMSIPDIFEKFGEKYFRGVESSVLEEVGKQSGKIISTGGGIVISAQNKSLIRQNGYVIFIERDTENLVTDGRPLSKSAKDLKEMYNKRLPLYRNFCDKIINGNDSIDAVASEIIKTVKAIEPV